MKKYFTKVVPNGDSSVEAFIFKNKVSLSTLCWGKSETKLHLNVNSDISVEAVKEFQNKIENIVNDRD